MKNFTSQTIRVGDENLAVRLYSAHQSSCKPLILFLHGAGQANQEAFVGVCEYLQNQGIACVSFDFSGHGESSAYATSSVMKKTQEALAVYEYFSQLYEKIHLFAFSMSGQIAVNMIGIHKNIQSITLFAPALYAENAMNIPFGQAFKEAISIKDSWQNTNAYSILKAFQGKVTLIVPEYENVIPEGVLNIYRQSSVQEHFNEIFVANAPHTLGSWFKEEPMRFSLIFEQIKHFNHFE